MKPIIIGIHGLDNKPTADEGERRQVGASIRAVRVSVNLSQLEQLSARA